MQQLQDILHDKFTTKWYFAFGAPEKTSLSITYCRQNGFDYFSNPTIEKLKQCQKHAIIEGNLQLFKQIEKIKPQLSVIFFGKQLTNADEKRIRKQYLSIGKCKDVPVLDHAACRKALYPNLIFVYGPDKQQNGQAAITLSHNIQYQYSQLPKDPNELIANSDKTTNYIINGLFKNANQIKILDEYFNIRIIHFKYRREDLPQHAAFFDEEHDLLTFLKGKNYYIPVKGDDDPVLIMDNVGVGLCPRLLFINYDKNQKSDYVNQYLNQTDGLLLSIYDIQAILKRKNIPLVKNFQQKMLLLNKILYKDLNRKQILFTDFPWQTPEFVQFQNVNRKFTYFIDLTNPAKYQYSKQFSSPIYFLQTQRRICPSFDLTLKQQLNQQNQYWIVNGAGTCGKTSVAKYIASQFGFKLIQFQTQAAAAKQKIASPEDGDEVPVKKYIAYFANIIKSNPKNTYIFDALPYTGADLQLWVKQVGCPSVINLKAQAAQLIRRARKKAESDVNAQVTQQQTAKVNESLQKNNEWVQKLGQYGPSSKIYQVDYSQPQLLSQVHINSILKPRIFLVQRHNSLTYQNIAIKYDMGFVNLARIPLTECKDMVRKFNKRDVILCYYGQFDERLVSEDMYWIEKNLGEIRYLGIWQPEQVQINEKVMHLERPPVPEKPKPAQGEQAKQEQPPAEQEQGKPKKVFDIYQYQWTQPVSHKNLSQWFYKLKKSVNKRVNNPLSCYDKFHEVLDGLNNDSNLNFYESII